MSRYYGTLLGLKSSRNTLATRCGHLGIEAHCRTWDVGGRVITSGYTGGKGAHSVMFELTCGSNRWGHNILVAEYTFSPEGALIDRRGYDDPATVAQLWSEQWLARMGGERA